MVDSLEMIIKFLNEIIKEKDIQLPPRISWMDGLEERYSVDPHEKIGLKVIFMLMCSLRVRDKKLKHLDDFLNGPHSSLETIASISIQEIADKIKNIGMQNRDAFYIQQTLQKIKPIWDGCIPQDSKVLKTCNGIGMKIAFLVVQYIYGIVQVCTNFANNYYKCLNY